MPFPAISRETNSLPIHAGAVLECNNLCSFVVFARFELGRMGISRNGRNSEFLLPNSSRTFKSFHSPCGSCRARNLSPNTCQYYCNEYHQSHSIFSKAPLLLGPRATGTKALRRSNQVLNITSAQTHCSIVDNSARAGSPGCMFSSPRAGDVRPSFFPGTVMFTSLQRFRPFIFFAHRTSTSQFSFSTFTWDQETTSSSLFQAA
jgi:hypothetical protein